MGRALQTNTLLDSLLMDGVGLLERLEIHIISYHIVSQASVIRSLKGNLPTTANTLTSQKCDWY